MENAQIAKKYTTDDGERRLLVWLLDMAGRAADSGRCFYSSFLSPAERALALRVPELAGMVALSFDGGYPDAERTLALLCPHGEQAAAAPLSILAVQYKGDPLSHRDILGALTALGIKREKLGDILVGDGRALLLCDSAMAPYICDQLERAGRNRVRAVPTEFGDMPPPRFESRRFSVQSPWLDSVVAGGYGVSRADAADAVEKGGVFVNWRQVCSPGKTVAEGDRISMRGHGKLRVSRIGGQSRKGRTFIEVDRYV